VFVRLNAEEFMKIVIVSDIHANLAALEALPEREFDQLWCIGDLVDYGPRPHEAVQWVKRNARRSPFAAIMTMQPGFP
jgi:hypothetical protein